MYIQKLIMKTWTFFNVLIILFVGTFVIFIKCENFENFNELPLSSSSYYSRRTSDTTYARDNIANNFSKFMHNAAIHNNDNTINNNHYYNNNNNNNNTAASGGNERVLSRKRRYLIFPEGSSFQVGKSIYHFQCEIYIIIINGTDLCFRF